MTTTNVAPDGQPAASDAAELTLAEQAALVTHLRAALQARQPGVPVESIETHISFVLVGVEFAWKLKKALDPGFLDFTSLARRRQCCEDEVRLNRRLAPALYLDVVPVTGTVTQPGFGGTGPAIEYAVRMRAFDQSGLWDRLARQGGLLPAHVDDLAMQLDGFHRTCEVATADRDFGHPAQVRLPMLDNLAALAAACPAADVQAQLSVLRAWEADAFATLEPVFEDRLRDGRVRDCHGDLHLGNVAQVDGRTTVFDCIEFNAAFRWIDVMNELAFMAMDLHSHGLRALGHRFVNACLERSGDYGGVRVLRYYLVYRALVRAKVAAIRAAQGAQQPAGVEDPVRPFLDVAAATMRPSPPRVLIAHGFSGSGKTTGTQTIIEAEGAIRLRADVERKRLFGLDALARSGAGIDTGLYDPSATERTYRRLCELADPVLAGGCSVVLDATFLQRAQRDLARKLAHDHGVGFGILDFAVDADTLRERVRQRQARGGDASEATVEVLEAQFRAAQPLGPDEASDIVQIPPASS